MDDLDKSRTNLMVSSVIVILFFGGLATFGERIELPFLGIQIKNSKVFPVVLLALWLYFWQRFTSLSYQKHAAEMQSTLRDEFNKKQLVRKLFLPAEYKLPEDCEVAFRPWLQASDQPGTTFSPVIYKRFFLARVIELSYIGTELHVHFIDQKSKEWGPHVERARVSFPSGRYMKCLWYEILYFTSNFQQNPMVVPYFFPRLLALAAATSIAVWATQ